MTIFDLEEVWNGRFTDTQNDELQQIAKASFNFDSFIYNVRILLDETI